MAGLSFVPKRQRGHKRRERIGFALELAMLDQGRGLAEVMISAFGNCSAGQVWQSAMHDLLEALPTYGLRRRVLGHFLRWFGSAKMHGSQWRVVNADGFVGRAVETVRELDEQHVDELTGEVTETFRERTAHVPAFRGGRAGGLAAHEKRAPRTLHRYRHVLRGGLNCTHKPRSARGRYLRQSGAGAIVASSQPPKTASDAVMPRRPGAEYPYAQAWLLLPPSPEMLSRWGCRAASGADAPSFDLGSRALPRLPSAPEALRDVLTGLRER